MKGPSQCFFGEVFSFAESYSGLWVRCGGDDFIRLFYLLYGGERRLGGVLL